MNNLTGLSALARREIKRFLNIYGDTLVTPLISSLLYLFIFGYSIGKLVPSFSGISYMEFIIPGIIMMSVIQSSYANTSFSIFISKWAGNIADLLTAPLSYMEIVIAITIGGVTRGLLVAAGVYLVSAFFAGFLMYSFLHTFVFLALITIVFSLAGIVVAIVSDDFEHLTVFNAFILTPLVFMGGVFHPVNILPPLFQKITMLNPLFYMVSGFRYGLTGVAETSVLSSFLVLVAFIVVLFVTVVTMFKRGYKLRT
ncbi:TPA: ABC transporter permease [archaeon]|nr:ABC transporter permease [Candidatus Undinarchaeales archaeon SRR5007147.bin71]